MYTIAEAKRTVSDGIKAYLRKDADSNYILKEVNCIPFYLEGAPGIGKTEIVHQIAEELQLGFVSFSLVHHTRNSLVGLPEFKELETGEKYTKYTMSEVIAAVNKEIEKGHKEGILLLDEFPCMSESIVPAMLAFLQTKNIGSHSLQRGWVIVLCGNPAKFNKSSRSFDAAVTDRIRKIEIAYNLEDFLNYAKEKNFSEDILEYLQLNPNHMYRFQKNSEQEELVTCRGWENLSHTLKMNEVLGQLNDAKLVAQFIKSEEISIGFAEFYSQRHAGMTEEDRNAVLEGIITDSLVSKYKRLEFNKKWNVLSYLEAFIKSDANLLIEDSELISNKIVKEENKSKYKQIGEKIDRVFHFLSLMDRSGNLEEKLYLDIVNQEKLLKAICQVESQCFVEQCKKQYGTKKCS